MLEQEISYLSDKGNILLAGDFNACTATNSDFVPLDNPVHLLLPPDYAVDSESPHFSQDLTLNVYGKQLLDLCQAARLRISNGRTGQDRNLKFTCYTAHDSSVVDYVKN